MTDLCVSQREIICEGLFDTTGLITPGTVLLLMLATDLGCQLMGMGYFTAAGAEQ